MVGTYTRDSELGRVTFPDKSFIELRKFGNHQLTPTWTRTGRSSAKLFTKFMGVTSQIARYPRMIMKRRLVLGSFMFF